MEMIEAEEVHRAGADIPAKAIPPELLGQSIDIFG